MLLTEGSLHYIDDCLAGIDVANDLTFAWTVLSSGFEDDYLRSLKRKKISINDYCPSGNN